MKQLLETTKAWSHDVDRFSTTGTDLFLRNIMLNPRTNIFGLGLLLLQYVYAPPLSIKLQTH